MSLRLKIPCNEAKKEIGIFNHIKALYIPLGVSIQVSFKDTPKDDELYPLTDTVSDLDANGDMVERARRCFLHISGTSTEEIDLVASNVIPGGGYVNVEQMNTFALEPTTKNVLEDLTLTQLDKIINPYNFPTVTQVSSTSTSDVTMLDKTLSCDMIKVFLSTSTPLANINLKVLIDGINVMKLISYWDSNGGFNINDLFKEFTNVRGKSIKIIGRSTADSVDFRLEEYTLK